MNLKNFINKCCFYGFTVVFLFNSMAMCAVEAKFGVVNHQFILENSPYERDYRKRMQKELDLRHEKITKMQQILKTKYDALQRDKDILSESDCFKIENEFEKLQTDIQKMAEQFDLEMRQKDIEEIQLLQTIFTEAIQEIALKERIDFIIPQHMTLFHAEHLDLTDMVRNQLDERYMDLNKKTNL